MTHRFLLFLFTDFDLEKEKAVLDEQGLRIAENQENSQKNRRKLAESTRGIYYTSLNNQANVSHFVWKGNKEEEKGESERGNDPPIFTI
jgi:homeobox protein cut-like